jgi:hypothetical protein
MVWERDSASLRVICIPWLNEAAANSAETFPLPQSVSPLAESFGCLLGSD